MKFALRLIAATIVAAYALLGAQAEPQRARKQQNAPPPAPKAPPAVEVVEIPAGSFTMGSTVEPDEAPVRRVTISAPFSIGKFEITQAQWKAVMGTNPSQFVGDDLPVERVTWVEAREFVKRLSALSGKTWRLPTEAEWEYAARAGEPGMWSHGDDEDGLTRFSWFDENARQRTHAVGTRKPNAWGLFDVHGNVWEWCEDWYGDAAYKGGDAVDPRGPGAGSQRVLRGGSYGSIASGCRSANRYSFDPDERFVASGLRVVLEHPK
jgi:formylglycine-generating enzyme required for sulfatase activity